MAPLPPLNALTQSFAKYMMWSSSFQDVLNFTSPIPTYSGSERVPCGSPTMPTYFPLHCPRSSVSNVHLLIIHVHKQQQIITKIKPPQITCNAFELLALLLRLSLLARLFSPPAQSLDFAQCQAHQYVLRKF